LNSIKWEGADRRQQNLSTGFWVAKYEIYTGVTKRNQNFRDASVNWQIPTYHNVLSASPE